MVHLLTKQTEALLNIHLHPSSLNNDLQPNPSADKIQETIGSKTDNTINSIIKKESILFLFIIGNEMIGVYNV